MTNYSADESALSAVKHITPLPAPMVIDGGPVQPLSGAALSAMPRKEPLEVAGAPTAFQKPRRTSNRKQRKAMEAKQHKVAKARKRVAG